MFKTIRRSYWITQIFLKKHAKIILRSAAIILSVFTVIIIFARYLPTPKSTVKIGRVGKYTPTSIPLDLQNILSNGLVTLDNQGNIKPNLADSWTISDNGTTYTFTLGKHTWNDGSPVTPEDVDYNFQDVDITRTDNTITYHLKEPYAPFMQAMTKPILKKNSIGTTDFRLTHTKTLYGVLESLMLENNTTRYLYKFYPTENSAITAYKLGEVARLEGLSSLPADLATDPTSELESLAGDKITAVFMNNADSLLSSKTTRQGLAYAIPDKSFGKSRALSPISSNSWAYNDLVKDYAYDPSRAKTLFTEDVKDPSSVKIELKTMLPYLDTAESIAASWREVLGINVDVKVVSTASSDYQAILADFIPPSDPDQYSLWHSTQATNFTHYSNLKVDKLLEDGRRTLDQKLRKDIYEDFQRFLLEDSPAIFLFNTQTYSIQRHTLI